MRPRRRDLRGAGAGGRRGLGAGAGSGGSDGAAGRSVSGEEVVGPGAGESCWGCWRNGVGTEGGVRVAEAKSRRETGCAGLWAGVGNGSGKASSLPIGSKDALDVGR